ncbi:hypothetical protein FRC09_010799 [Ceratobasidium sp. 395]|nr:hypothetical protein FRC09_010799 [Ceratobasidium sp. 395]
MTSNTVDSTLRRALKGAQAAPGPDARMRTYAHMAAASAVPRDIHAPETPRNTDRSAVGTGTLGTPSKYQMAARMDGVSCPPRASIAGTDVPACPQVARIGNPPYPTERIARPSRACPNPSHPFVPDTQSARDVIDVKYPTLSTHFQTPHRRRVSHSATPAHRSEASYDARYFPLAFDVENTHIPELETNSRGIENEGRTCRNEITRSPQKRTRGLSTQQVQQVQQAQQHAEDMAYLQSLINDKERLKRVQSSLPHIATSAGSLFAEILSELSKSAHGSEYEYSEWKTECNSASTSAEGRANDLGQRIDRLEAEGRAKNHPTQNSRRAARVREDPSRNSHGELHLGDTGTYSAARRDNSRTRIKFERKVKKLKRKAKQRRRANIELKEPTPYQGQVNYDEFELWSYQVDQWLSEIGFKGRKAEYTVDSLKASLFGYFFPANFKSELRNEFNQAQQGEHRFIDYLRLLQRFQRRLPDISDLQLCIKLCDTVHTYIKIGWIEAGMDPESTDLETLSIAAQRFETAKTIKDLLVTHADDNSDGYRADYDAYESQSDCSEAETAGPGPEYEADRSNPGTGDNSDVESKYSAESSASDAGQSDTENDASDDRGAYGLDYEDQSDPDHEETGDSESEPDVEPGAASRYEPGHDEYSSMYAEPGTELHPSEANQSDGEDIDAYYLEYEEGKSVASGYSSDTESDSSYLSKPLRSLEGRAYMHTRSNPFSVSFSLVLSYLRLARSCTYRPHLPRIRVVWQVILLTLSSDIATTLAFDSEVLWTSQCTTAGVVSRYKRWRASRHVMVRIMVDKAEIMFAALLMTLS